MKIILKDEVPTLGAYGEVIQVADGYARNYLIPKGLGIEATVGNQRQFEAEKEAWLSKAAALKEGAAKIAEAIGKLTLSFTRKAGEDDKLFGSVTSMDIDAALKEKLVEVDRKKILLAEPIKSLGTFPVAVKLHPEVTAEVKVEVVKEDQ